MIFVDFRNSQPTLNHMLITSKDNLVEEKIISTIQVIVTDDTRSESYDIYFVIKRLHELKPDYAKSEIEQMKKANDTKSMESEIASVITSNKPEGDKDKTMSLARQVMAIVGRKRN